MSKSDPNQNSRIPLMDNADLISSKIRKAKTDCDTIVSYDPEKRPEIANLIDIYCALSEKTNQ